MKILLVTYIYAPDNGPSAPMFALLCQGLVKKGHEVTVIATVPHFPDGKVRVEYRNKWIQETIEEGVHIRRIRIPSLSRKNFLFRLIQFLVFQILASIACLKGRYDVAIVTNPALNKGLPFFIVATLRNIPSVFLVSDVYPDVGISTGVFRHRLVVKGIELLEQYCLKSTDLVWVFSDSFIPRMISMGVQQNHVEILGPWVDTDFFQPLPKKNSFSSEFGLVNKFVVLYAGNIGLSQGLENILYTARDLQANPEILFVLLGDGLARDQLMRQSAEMNLGNVLFIPFQPWERVPEVMASADLFLISLKPEIGEQSLPSKSFTYLASSRPILAIVEEDSAIWNLVQDSGSGVCIHFGNIDVISETILSLYSNPKKRHELAENGRNWVVFNNSVHHAVERVEEITRKAVDLYNSKGI